MSNKGVALMGVGVGSGERRMLEAAQRAVNSPLLDDISLSGATSVLINITGSSNLTMFEIHEASTMIQEEAHEDANVIWGWVVDDDMEDDSRITVIATGFEEGYTTASAHTSAKPPAPSGPQPRQGRTNAPTGPWWKSGQKGGKSGSGRISDGEYDIPPFHRRPKKR